MHPHAGYGLLANHGNLKRDEWKFSILAPITSESRIKSQSELTAEQQQHLEHFLGNNWKLTDALNTPPSESANKPRKYPQWPIDDGVLSSMLERRSRNWITTNMIGSNWTTVTDIEDLPQVGIPATVAEVQVIEPEISFVENVAIIEMIDDEFHQTNTGKRMRIDTEEPIPSTSSGNNQNLIENSNYTPWCQQKKNKCEYSLGNFLEYIKESEYPILKAYFLKLNLTFAFPYTMQGHDQLPIVQDVTSIENSKKHICAHKREAKRKMTRSCGEQLCVSCAGDKGSSRTPTQIQFNASKQKT
ncbi:hypothetical protein CBL_05174 [Carabus blaptoides fortunei]